MTTRDPRPGDLARPEAQGSGRDPTQSLSVDGADAGSEVDPDSRAHGDEPSFPSLALGTHEASARDERTRIESPQARSKTPTPPRAPTRPPPVPAKEDPDDRIGSVLGNYKVLELLGKGGMGFVYRAEHVKLGREVALKLLRSDYARRKDAVARFIQEARTVNRIRHRNIVDVPDILELDDGTTCIVMEFLRGQSLGKWARTGVDLPRALAVLVQICDGLAAAHAVDIVHRDLKPDNVFVVPTADGAELVKLLDFGVAKLLHREDEDVGFQTAAGSVIGTPAYMSPEQAGGMPIDARSDIYSLGAIMYELFTGQPMFRGRSFGEYVRKHLTELPVPPRQTAGGAHLDERLEAVILRAIDKDPAQRFAHILELRDALLLLLGAGESYHPSYVALSQSGLRPAPGTTLPPLPLPVPPTPPPGAYLSMPPGSAPYTYGHYSQIVGLPASPPPAPTPWWVWILGGAGAIALGVAAAIWYAGGDQAIRQDGLDPVANRAASTAPDTQPDTQPDEQSDTQPEARLAPLPAPGAAPRYVTVRIDSLPSGGVYEDGKSAELCRTPCEFNVEVASASREAQRTYVVKAAGHRDGTLSIDLTAPRPEGRVTLVPLASPPAESDSPGRPSRSNKPPRSPRTRSADRADASPAPSPSSSTTSSTPSTPTRVEKKPSDRSGGKIDRSDTLDPFR